jgi:SAM-dependent methyltransferase
MGTPPSLTILMVNYNSRDFVRLNLKALSLLTVSTYQVFLCDNGSERADFEALRADCSLFPNVTLISRVQTRSGSMGHGEALNLLTRFIDTPYGAIFDADCVPLMRGWDQRLIAMLDDRHKIAGTPVSPNSPKNYKPVDFPLMFLCLFETRTFRELGIDFRPRDMSLGQDTGWELREKYRAAGYAGAILHGENTRSYRSGPLAASICDEYYLGPDRGALFCSHLGRGSAPTSGKYAKSRRASLNAYKADKARWLATCEALIDAEERSVPGLAGREYPRCDLCGAAETLPHRPGPWEAGGIAGFWDFVECGKCGLVYLRPRPADLPFPPGPTAPAPAAPAPPSGSGRRLLEIGCAKGGRLRAWADKGWAVEGLEADPSAGGAATGLKVTMGSPDSFSSPPVFDRIIVSVPLDRIPEPRAFLSRAGSWLKPGGTLALACANRDTLEAVFLGSSDAPPAGALYRIGRAQLGRYLSGYRVAVRSVPDPEVLAAARGQARGMGSALWTALPGRVHAWVARGLAATGRGGRFEIEAVKPAGEGT